MNKSAYEAGVAWGMEKAAADMGKEAIFGLGKKKEPFKPSFKGHQAAISEAVGPKKTTDARGVVTNKNWDNLGQKVKQKKYVTLHTPKPVKP
jgi:hypothetical protein